MKNKNGNEERTALAWEKFVELRRRFGSRVRLTHYEAETWNFETIRSHVVIGRQMVLSWQRRGWALLREDTTRKGPFWTLTFAKGRSPEKLESLR